MANKVKIQFLRNKNVFSSKEEAIQAMNALVANDAVEDGELVLMRSLDNGDNNKDNGLHEQRTNDSSEKE